MACRTVCLAAVACAIVAGAAAGCRRSPLGDQDAAADQGQGPSRGDGGMSADVHTETGSEATADLTSVDSEVEAAVDAAPETVVDGPVDVTSPDDAPGDGGAPDRAAASDGGDARPEDQPCGPARTNCAAYACDVTAGTCKTICFTDDDCFQRRPCLQGICGTRVVLPCTDNRDCNSGFCAQGVCCRSACSGTCQSCALPASLGTCTTVPNGMPNPNGGCPDGGVCDGRNQCVPSSCAVAADCGRYHSCYSGRCMPCNATCASNADCFYATCVDNNGCTTCVPDAGADL